MPLDPHAKNLLDLLVAAGRPKVWQVGAVEGREGLRKLSQAADAKDVPIGRVEDGEWPGPAGALPYRAYMPVDAALCHLPAGEPESPPSPLRGEGWGVGERTSIPDNPIVPPSPDPRLRRGSTSPQRGEVKAGSSSHPLYAAPEPLPALLYFHGGGFVIGDLDTHDGLCRLLANASGCRVISVEYRLAPEHKFPAAVEDASAAACWVAEHARELGIDPGRIAIGGDSAGANLAAVACQLARQAGGPRLALQLLLYPGTVAAETASRRAFAEGYLLEKKSIEWFYEQYVEPGTDPNDPRLSPLLALDLSGLPPAHIHTAEFDPLVDEGKAYAEKLAAAGVKVEYVCHPGMIHHFFCLAGAIPYARTAIANVGTAIKQALAPALPAGARTQRRASI
jgi:acetyl esterase